MFGLSPLLELENGQRENFIYKVKLSTAVEEIANIHFSNLIDKKLTGNNIVNIDVKV